MTTYKSKYFFASLLVLFLGFPSFLGNNLNSAFAMSSKVNPVGTNLIVDIAKKQNLMLKMRFTSSGVGEHQIGMPQGDTRQQVERLLGELNVMS